MAASQVELGKTQLEQAKESAEESADLTNRSEKEIIDMNIS